MLNKYQSAKYISIIGVLINIFLGIIKILGGIFYYSHALIADGIHSLSDLLSDAIVLFATKYGHKDADATHQYGHKRIETASTLLLSLILIFTGCSIIWDAIFELIIHFPKQPMYSALIIAILSIFIKEILFFYTKRIGQEIQSALIIANAWHHRSDSASSAVVAIGLIASLYGFLYFDTIAAIIVGCMIIKMGINYAWNSIKELIDTAITIDDLEKIQNIIYNIDGVQKIHQLRSRSMAGDILIDVHIIVNPFISVSEGHYIAQHVHLALINNFNHIKDVTVHIDPEDDEKFNPSLNLPNRIQIEKEIYKLCNNQNIKIIIHYLDAKLLIDIFYENDIIETYKDNIQQYLNKSIVINTVNFYKLKFIMRSSKTQQ